MATALYKIPAENIGKLREQIASLNRKIEKLNKKGYSFAPVGLVIDEEHPLIEKHSCTVESGDTITEDRIYYAVTVSGEEVVVAGWRFVATLQHEEGGTVIRSVPGTVSDGELARYRDAKPGCDHCGYKRRRNDTFILRNEETRELKQVGSSCLEDFTGHDVHAMATMAELLASLGLILTSLLERGGGMSADSYIPLSTYLPFVARSIREDGWLSRGAAWEMGDRSRSTADRSFNLMVDHFNALRKGNRILAANTKPSEADEASARSTLDYLADYFDLVDEMSLNDYQHNLRVTFQGQVVSYRLAGLAASMINYVARDIEEKAAKDRMEESQFVGEIGKRTVMELTCIYLPKGGRPGVFRDSHGNTVKAWSAPPTIEEGKTYKIKCTPTKHDTYREVKSTMVNRLAVEE